MRDGNTNSARAGRYLTWPSLNTRRLYQGYLAPWYNSRKHSATWQALFTPWLIQPSAQWTLPVVPYHTRYTDRKMTWPPQPLRHQVHCSIQLSGLATKPKSPNAWSQQVCKPGGERRQQHVTLSRWCNAGHMTTHGCGHAQHGTTCPVPPRLQIRKTHKRLSRLAHCRRTYDCHVRGSHQGHAWFASRPVPASPRCYTTGTPHNLSSAVMYVSRRTTPLRRTTGTPVPSRRLT